MNHSITFINKPTMENLLILNVTIEQENAVEDLFCSKSWTFLNLAKTISQTIKNGILSTRIEKLDKTLCNDPKEQTTKLRKKQTKEGSFTENTNVASKKRSRKLNQVFKTDKNDSLKARKDVETDGCQGELNDSTFKLTTRATRRSFKNNLNSADTISEVAEKKENVQLSQDNEMSEDFVKSGPKKKFSSKITKEGSIKFKGGNNKELETDFDTYTLNIDLEISNENIGGENNINNFETIESKTDYNVEKNKTEDNWSEKVNKIEDKRHNCDKCSYMTNVKSNLNRHVKEMHSDVRYQCPICKKTYKGKHNAKMHEILAHSNQIKCDKCDKKFSSLSGLRNHSKSAHRKESLYKCQTCKRSFLYKSHYMGHMNKHNDTKPFACKKCEKPFSYKTACQVHEKNCNNGNFYMTHNADGSKKDCVESDFLCDICGVGGLKSKSSLKMHHFYAHSDTSQCVCTLCGKFVKGIYSLRRHMKTQHEENVRKYPCSLCDKSFTQRHVLKDHLKLHNKEYSCFCETCGKGFLTQFKMKEHARVHTGEKPFVCTICSTFKTSTKTNLQKHLKSHDKNMLPRQPNKKKTPAKVIQNKSQMIDEMTHVESDLQPSSPKPVFLESYNGHFEQSRLLEGQGHYTTLNGIDMENTTSKFPPNYDHGYNVVEENTQVNHHGDIDGNNARNSSGCYGNDSHIETTDQSQGLNILTIAMRIVDPDQY
ncbi:hypothetical protein ACF0H5_007415 [Mactra antiquata]